MRGVAAEEPCPHCGGSGIEPDPSLPGTNPLDALVDCAELCRWCGGTGEDPK